MSDRVIEAKGLAKVNADAVTHFLGFKADGTPALVAADSMMIYRGVVDSDTSIDDPALAFGIYSLSGSPSGTFPVTASAGAAMLMNWKAASITVPRFQILVYYWNGARNGMFIRRYVGNSWQAWREIALTES